MVTKLVVLAELYCFHLFKEFSICSKESDWSPFQVFLTGAPEYVFWLLSLLSPSAFAMAYDKLFLLDIEQRDIDFWEADGTVPLGGILIMMSADIVLYGLLAYYLDNVLPTEYGTRRKPWFPFQLSFWVSET